MIKHLFFKSEGLAKTLDATPGCALLTLFDSSSGEAHQSLYLPIDWHSIKDRLTDKTTIEWWSQQDEEVRDQIFDEDRLSPEEVLTKTVEWLPSNYSIWFSTEFDRKAFDYLYPNGLPGLTYHSRLCAQTLYAFSGLDANEPIHCDGPRYLLQNSTRVAIQTISACVQRMPLSA